MNVMMRIVAFCLPGIAAMLLSNSPACAMPLFAPLLQPAPLRALLSPPQSALLTSAPLPLPPGQPLLTKSALGKELLWNRALDPSLLLTDWRHVFNIAALGAFDIPLRSDPAERTNILLSAAAIDNVVVAPGAEFSFNDQVGERTPERGYQDGLMFDNGQIVRGTGGGICLVATGLYNAALRAGLEITERHPHSGIVTYAPPGCDAGIYYGQEDMKFRNTTPRPIVIRAITADEQVTVQIFGQTPPPGRSVTVKPTWLEPISYTIITKQDPTLLPGQVVVDQKPRAGYAVVVERFWTEGQHILRQEVVTAERRAPRPKIIRVGPPLAPVSLQLPGLYQESGNHSKEAPRPNSGEPEAENRELFLSEFPKFGAEGPLLIYYHYQETPRRQSWRSHYRAGYTCPNYVIPRPLAACRCAC